MSMMPNMINNQMSRYQNQQRQRQEQLQRRRMQSCCDTEMSSDRYGKISKKDTSQGFIQLLRSGAIFFGFYWS